MNPDQTTAKTRDEAWRLLTEWTASDSLRKHALAVETAMRGAARRAGADEHLWGLTGLLHDFDYERYPDPPDHPTKGAEVLRREGYPEEMITAILGHASYTGVPRETLLAKTLFAVDELSGFLTAVAYVRPSRSLAEVEVASVKKKLKDKAFARSVSRDDIAQGASEIGLDLDAHIARVLADLQGNAEALGL
jgi:putative nucleotidyltransferase with HDIG domain